MERVKCATCDNLVLKDVERVCWTCTAPKAQKTKKMPVKPKIAKPKLRKYRPPAKKVLRHLSETSAESLKAYTKEWFDSPIGKPPGTVNNQRYEDMWIEMNRVFMLCAACKWACQHVCQRGCWEGESY